MIELDLDDEERAILKTVLESYLSDLRMEIAHTVRGDGVIEIDVRASVLTDDGAPISAEIQGVMIDGRIRDTSVKLLTGHPAYQWLHDKIIVGKGWSVGDALNVRYYVDLSE